MVVQENEAGNPYGHRIQLPQEKTKREEFLEIVDGIILWDEWVGVIEPYYPKGKRGRPPMGIEKNAADVSAADLVQLV